MKANKVYSLRKKLIQPLLIYTVIFFLLLFTFLVGVINYIMNLSESIISERFLIRIAIILCLVILVFIIGFAFIALRGCKEISQSINILANDTKKLLKSSYRIENEIKTFDYIEAQDLNENIHLLAKRLSDYHDMQKTVIANAYHELRTPLMSIQGYAEGIKHNIFEDINDPLDIIISESKHIRDLSNSILRLSELDSQNVIIKKKKINLYNSLSKIVNAVGGVAILKEKNIQIIGENKFCIITDEDILEECIRILLSNAIRYAAKEITISFKKSSDEVYIQVKDDGEGINIDDLEHIFIRYYKGKNGKFGLGLSIAKMDSKYLGGDIKVLPSSKGACFELRIPFEK